jgi:CDP-glycerol glycerophosphotransferase
VPPDTDDGVLGVHLEGADLVVRGRGALGSMVVQGPRGRAAGAANATEGGFEARASLVQDRWGRGATGLPTGRYRLLDGHGGPLTPTDELAGRLPVVVRSDHVRATLLRGGGGGLVVQLAPPLEDDEVGPAAQQRLRASYAHSDVALDPTLVHLQTFAGEAATDSPRALHDELRRQRPDLRLVWAVTDRSVEVPPGAETVVVGSRAHYDTLARASWVVTNNDLEAWYVRRPGQRVLQTYHGYPSKAMGLAAWEAKGLTPARVAVQLARTSATWSLLLTPDEAMDEHYRTQYRYDGPIVAAGYPRDDILVGDAVEDVRARTRAALGIGDRVAVLYAPTWRDDLATNFRSAPLPTAFDVEAAAEELGDGYVLLLRGHRFHRQRPALDRRGNRVGARLLDVTDHPEVNDLVLAADLAVLDYSSLRFDVGLAGRPMVFFVPEVVRAGRAPRGFLYDYGATAPGPHVAGADEVVTWLRDPAALAASYAEQTAAFRARFHRHHDGHAARRVVDVMLRLEHPGTDHRPGS